MKLLRALALGLAVACPFPAGANQGGPPNIDCSEMDVVEYSAPEPQLFKRIEIGHAVPSDLETRQLEPIPSPQRTARLFVSKPDFMKDGPWTTQAYVTGNAARPLRISVVFRDHASHGVKAGWINEKLIHFNVAWGRIVTTDLILNVETAEVLYAEDANYGRMLLGCEQKRQSIGHK